MGKWSFCAPVWFGAYVHMITAVILKVKVNMWLGMTFTVTFTCVLPAQTMRGQSEVRDCSQTFAADQETIVRALMFKARAIRRSQDERTRS